MPRPAKKSNAKKSPTKKKKSHPTKKKKSPTQKGILAKLLEANQLHDYIPQLTKEFKNIDNLVNILREELDVLSKANSSDLDYVNKTTKYSKILRKIRDDYDVPTIRMVRFKKAVQDDYFTDKEKRQNIKVRERVFEEWMKKE